jgi:hypothetical protein
MSGSTENRRIREDGLGLTLVEAKQLLALVQRDVVAAQAGNHAMFRPDCQSCGGRCHVKDWRPHRIATVFGEVRLKLPRFLCAGCDRGETGVGWPSHHRSTPELDQLRARLSALMPYRVAADVLLHLLPISAGKSPETLRSHTLQIGKKLGDAATKKPPAAASAITVSLDSTFIRGREESERHLEVRVGNVETADGGRQVFGAVTRADTDITRADPANPRSRGPERQHRGDGFHRRVSGSADDPGQRRRRQTADSRLVSHRDAFATHEAGGGKFVDRRA